MKKILMVCFLVAVFVFPGCTATSTVRARNSLDSLSDEEVEAYNNDPKNTDRIVCTTETPTGSRISNRVCRKQSLINERSQDDQDALKAVQAGTLPPASK